MKRKLIELAEKSINVSHSLFSNNYRYYNAGLITGRFQGRDELQVERDDYREKYYLFIKKFNVTRKENDDLCEKLDKVNKDWKDNEDLRKKLVMVNEDNEDLRVKLEMVTGDNIDLREILESITAENLHENPDMVNEDFSEI